MKRAGRPRETIKEFDTKRVLSVGSTVVQELSEIPEVEYILYGERGSTKVVVSVINNFDPQARHTIYGRQRAIARRLPNEQFDFYVVARENRNPQEFLPTDMQLIYGRGDKDSDLK